MPWGTEVWPWVSNVADLWLIIGIGILLVRSLRAEPPKPVASA
jgi:lipoprotein signal peptidase